jgi:PAS domain S-box-containing protein
MPSTSSLLENGYSPVGTPIQYPHVPIAEIIGNGFFIVDRHWTVSSWSHMAEELVGISAADMLGKNLWKQLMNAIPKAFYTAYCQALLQDIPVHFTIYWPKKKNWFEVTTCYFDDSLSVCFKAGQNPENPVNPTNPETPETPADPEPSPGQQKSLNDMYRLITEVTTDCLWEWDFLAEQILWIDGGHKRVFGYEIQDALIPQRFWEARLHPDDKVRILTSIHGFFRQGIADDWEQEYRFQKFNGEYAHVHDRGRIVYHRDKRTSRMIGATQDITARKSAESQLRRSERNAARQQVKNQKEIVAAVLLAQEKERANIGKELHDNLNQILGAAKLYIEMAKTDEENRQMLLQRSAGYIVTVIEEIRDISKNLVGPRSNMMGLAESIKMLVEDVMRINPIHIQFREEGIHPAELNETLHLNIFRIVQEQLNNILKHANASQAEIHLAKRDNVVELVIADNGRGCNVAMNSEGVGIINIRSRAELYHGTVSILSRPGEGYVLKVGFPIPVSSNGQKKSSPPQPGN